MRRLAAEPGLPVRDGQGRVALWPTQYRPNKNCPRPHRSTWRAQLEWSTAVAGLPGRPRPYPWPGRRRAWSPQARISLDPRTDRGLPRYPPSFRVWRKASGPGPRPRRTPAGTERFSPSRAGRARWGRGLPRPRRDRPARGRPGHRVRVRTGPAARWPGKTSGTPVGTEPARGRSCRFFTGRADSQDAAASIWPGYPPPGTGERSPNPRAAPRSGRGRDRCARKASPRSDTGADRSVSPASQRRAGGIRTGLAGGVAQPPTRPMRSIAEHTGSLHRRGYIL